jgi:hypothetical protein
MKTKAEIFFEEFCGINHIKWEKLKENEKPTPDYKVFFNDDIVFIEVKQIDKDVNFSAEESSRTVGSHIREKIKEARKQLKAVSNKGFPTILLIFNNLDGSQMFGTEQEDFITAMYGDRTLLYSRKKKKVVGSIHGKNCSFNEEKSTYFSAVGFLYKTKENVKVLIYENAYTKNPLNFSNIPKCIEIMRIELERVNLTIDKALDHGFPSIIKPSI